MHWRPTISSECATWSWQRDQRGDPNEWRIETEALRGSAEPSDPALGTPDASIGPFIGQFFRSLLGDTEFDRPMNRYTSLAISATATIFLLWGLSIGLHIGLSWVESRQLVVTPIRWSSVAEIAIWVVPLILPTVLLLRRSRAFWPTVVTLALAIAAVSFWRFGSLPWAAADGVGFVLGLQFFRLVLAICNSFGLQPSARGRRLA